MAKSTVLIVDDEVAILQSLQPFLERSGYQVSTATDGAAALAIIRQEQPDIVVLDVLMPKLDGRELLRTLRQQEIWTPVILLTQVGNATERAMALTEGADDYLNKPYDPHELVARIGSVLRRSERGSRGLASADRLNAGAISFDRHGRTVTLDQQRLALTPRALQLLEYLLLHPNELLTRERLLNAVWGWTFATGTRSVDARIVELRKALQDDPTKPTYIETVPSQGYRFLAVTEAATT